MGSVGPVVDDQRQTLRAQGVGDDPDVVGTAALGKGVHEDNVAGAIGLRGVIEERAVCLILPLEVGQEGLYAPMVDVGISFRDHGESARLAPYVLLQLRLDVDAG